MRIRSICLLLIFFASVFLPGFPTQASDVFRQWDKVLGFTDWKSASPDTSAAVGPDGLNINSGNPFPLVMTPTYLSVNLEEYDLLVIRMRSNREGAANVFWANYQTPNFDRSRMCSIYLGRKNEWRTYYIDLLSQEKGWLKRVDAVLINPFEGPGTSDIDCVRFERSGIFTKFAAGWQEFWGPRGRNIIGSTINTMQSSMIFGRPVFYYIYWAVFLFFIGKFLALLIRSGFRDIPFLGPVLFSKALFYSLMLLFGFWTLLEANNLFVEVRNLSFDMELFGKTLDEKRALVNAPGFNDFVNYCQKELPAGARIELVTPAIYDWEKFRYYLYPHEIEKGARFVVVFRGQPDAELLRRSKVHARLKDDAYILETI